MKILEEREKAGEALRALTLRYKAILAAVPDIIMEVDSNRVYTWANAAGYEFFGDDVIGREAAFYFEGKQQIYNMVQPLLNGSEDVIYVESWQRRKDSGKRLLAWWCRVLKDMEGNVTGALSTARDITDQRHTEETINRNLQIQHVLNSLINVSLEGIPLNELLGKALDIILSVPFLPLMPKGGIFLVKDEPDVLILTTNRGFSVPIQEICAKVPFGRCLCGRAAASRQIQFADCLDERHDNRYDGITNHGHYDVPIVSRDRVLGVLALYLPEGHQQEEGEVEFLQIVVNTLAGIIERKQAEVELHEKEHLLSESQRLGHVGSFLLDATDLLQWSNEMYHLFGVSAETFTPNMESLLSLIHPEDRPAMQAWTNAGVAGTKPDALDFRIKMPDGTIRFIRGNGEALHDDKNRLIYLAGMMQDITERKQADEALREKEEFSREILNSMDFSVAVLDRCGHITAVNKGWERFAQQNGGAPDKTGVGINYFDICRAEAPEALHGLEAVLHGMLERFELEYPCDSPDEKRWFVMRTSPLSKRRGGLIVTHINITERRRMEEELEKYNQELETKVRERTTELEEKIIQADSANRAKSEFLANMSHELRTPLNSIIGFSEILKDGMAGPMANNQKDLLNDIFTSGKQLLSLINDILDLSTVAAGKMQLELSEFSIEELIDSSLVMFKEKAMKHTIKIAAEIQTGIGDIIADERKIKQVLFNLLSNAFKFTPDGGSVSVAARKVSNVGALRRVAHDKEGQDSASPAQERDFIEISVTDTGIGISPEDQKKLFQPFQQMDSALSRKYSGTGLGLSLCKQFIELHGGRIWMEGGGKGSRFVILIPMKKE